MGEILVAGIEKFISARNASPEKRLERWQKATAALPLLAGLRELEMLGIGRGLGFSYAGRSPTIFTPLCVLPSSRAVSFRGLRSARILGFLQRSADTHNLFIQGPEADALDALAPSLKTETSINAPPHLLRCIPPGDSFRLLMQSRAHALRWRNEMLSNLDWYVDQHDLSSEQVPGPVRKLIRKKGREQDIDVEGLRESLHKACEAYAIGYMLYCGARLITDEMKESIHYLLNLGVSRVKQFDELLDHFQHLRRTAPKSKLPRIKDSFTSVMAMLVGRSLEDEIRRAFVKK